MRTDRLRTTLVALLAAAAHRTVVVVPVVWAISLAACNLAPSETTSSPASPVAPTALQARSGGRTIQLSMSGNYQAVPQTISGRNDANAIVAKGDYELDIDNLLDLGTCGPRCAGCAHEQGLVAQVRDLPAQVGKLDFQYDKPGGGAGAFDHIDNWITKIGDFNYRVQAFGFQTVTLMESANSSTVQFFNGQIEVYKMKGGSFISSERCSGPVSYAVTATK